MLARIKCIVILIFTLPIFLLAILFVTGCSNLDVLPIDKNEAEQPIILPDDKNSDEEKSNEETKPEEENENPKDNTFGIKPAPSLPKPEDESPSNKEETNPTDYEINITTFEEKFSYSFNENVICKDFDETNNAIYFRFELLENGKKVSGTRFEILVDCESVDYDLVNYNSVYLLLSEPKDFNLTIKVVDEDISTTIHVEVS